MNQNLMNQFPRVLPFPYLPLAPAESCIGMYLHTYTMHICTRYIHVHMQSICIYPSCIHAYGTHPLSRIKSDSLRKKYKFGIHTRGSDPFVRSYIEKKSKRERERKERTAVLGTVAETSQVVAIPDTSSSINTYTYLLYISLSPGTCT